LPDTRYLYNVDLDNPTTSHSLAILSVAPGSTVLDIGAADGSVARELTARGCRVWAIEANADAAALAQPACERVIVADVEDLDLEAALEGRRFDVVLLLDVLEHLREPLATLKRARDLVAEGGRIIVSIPNVTHGAVRLSLMSGAFTYTETGLLDKTHLRFFDRRGAEALFRDAGLQIVERLRVMRGLNETEIPIDPSAVPPQLLQKLDADPEATTYQFVLVGVPGEGGSVPESVSLAERLQRRTEELETQYRQLEGYVRSLDTHNREQAELVGRLTAQKGTLEEELQRLRTEPQTNLQVQVRDLAQRNLELRHLQADLAVKEAFIAEMRQITESTNADREQLRVALDDELRRVRTELHAETVARMRDLAQHHLEIRHLHADLGVKEAHIAELRQSDDGARAELARLRVSANAASVQLVSRVTGRLSRYPRLYRGLRRLIRRVARGASSAS
jgi:2-polyprenyl-3-methyl-5-hydroxy-6-metoxy-1,4-benzoquinol methylase